MLREREILEAAYNELNNLINLGVTEIDLVSFTEKYSIWSENPMVIKNLLWAMYEENFGELLTEY